MINKNIYNLITLSLFVLFLLDSCGLSKKNEQPEIKKVHILAVNDMHAAIDNFPHFAYVVDSVRTLYPEMLLFSGGDNQTGNPVNDLHTERGYPMIALMNKVGFDLSSVGNHEFDLGQKQFTNLRHQAKFDFLCANYHNSNNPAVNVDPYKILTMPNGIKVGVLGLVQLNYQNIPDTHPKNVKGIKFFDPFITALKYKGLRQECDLFVALTHLGYERDEQLARTMKDYGLDLIVGGHSNTLIEKNHFIENTMITQVDWKLSYATLITIKFKKGQITSRDMQLIDLRNGGREDLDVRAMVDKFNEAPELRRELAENPCAMKGKEPVGYLMTDALREESGVDLVFQNPGGVRIKLLSKGKITAMDMYRMDPFGNEFVKISMSGQEICDYLKISYPIDQHSPQFPSGCSLIYHVNDNRELQYVEVVLDNGSKLSMNTNYTVGLNSYIVAAYDFNHDDPGQSLFKETVQYVIEHLNKIDAIMNYCNEHRISYKIESK